MKLNKKTEAVAAEFHQVKDAERYDLRKYRRIPLTEAAGIAAIFAEAIPGVKTVGSITEIPVEGLWSLTLPKGVSGSLIKAKDGSGYMTAMVNKGRFTTPAHINPVDTIRLKQSVKISVNPMEIFMTVAMIGMDRKMDEIIEGKEKIYSFLLEREVGVRKGDLKELVDIYKNMKLGSHSSDGLWRETSYQMVREIRKECNGSVELIYSQITKAGKHTFGHTEQDTLERIDRVSPLFSWYQLTVFVYSFSRLLEVILDGKYSKSDLDNVYEDVSQWEKCYQEYFKEYYEHHLKRSANTTLEAKAHALIGKDNKSSRVSVELHRFKDRFSCAGSSQLSAAIRNADYLWNEPSELLTDGRNVYLEEDQINENSSK